jgi:PAS domain S-box-containing protein
MKNKVNRTKSNTKNKSDESANLNGDLISFEENDNWFKNDMDKTEKKYRRLFSVSPIGTAIFDLEGNYIEINDAYANILGIQKEEILRRSSIELIEEGIHGDSQDYLNHIIAKGLCGGLRELKLNDKDIVLSYVDTLLYDREEKPVGIISIVQDISGLKGQDGSIEYPIKLPEDIRNRVPQSKGIIDDNFCELYKEVRIFNPFKIIFKRFEREMINEIEDDEFGAHRTKGFFGRYLDKSFKKDDFIHEVAPSPFYKPESKEEEY